MLNCKEVTYLCSEEMERKLTFRERMALKMHLMMCSGCSNFHDQMGFVRKAMHMYSEGQTDTEYDVEK